MEALRIWGENIPYNTGRPKRELLTLRSGSEQHVTMRAMIDIFSGKVMKDCGWMDTLVWNNEISKGNVSENMDDVPTLTPYPVSGSGTAVIVAPGGGFIGLSRELEGSEIAAALNERGIGAFVLEYRLNPYRAPVCWLDAQRAVRYLRCHAAEWGLDPGRIGAMGFSAGGYTVGGAALLPDIDPAAAPGYTPDAVDAADGRPAFLGMIYPAVSYDGNPNPLYTMVGADYFDEEKRPALMRQYSLTAQLRPSDVPQFLCYGTRDPLKGFAEYEQRMTALDIPHETLVIPGASHGFGLRDEKSAFWIDRFAEWVKAL